MYKILLGVITFTIMLGNSALAVTEAEIQRVMKMKNITRAQAMQMLGVTEQHKQAQGQKVTPTPHHIQHEMARSAAAQDHQTLGSGSGTSPHHHPTPHALTSSPSHEDDEIEKMKADFERQKAEMLRQHQEMLKMKMLREQEEAAEQQRQTAEAERKKATLAQMKAQQEAELRAMQEALQKGMQEASHLGLGTGVTKPIGQAERDESTHKFREASRDLSKAERHLPSSGPSTGTPPPPPPPPNPDFLKQHSKPAPKPTGFRGGAAAIDSDEEDDIFGDDEANLPTEASLGKYIQYHNPQQNPLMAPAPTTGAGKKELYTLISKGPVAQPALTKLLNTLKSAIKFYEAQHGPIRQAPFHEQSRDSQQLQVKLLVWFIERAHPSIAFTLWNRLPVEPYEILSGRGGNIPAANIGMVSAQLPHNIVANFTAYKALSKQMLEKTKAKAPPVDAAAHLAALRGGLTLRRVAPQHGGPSHDPEEHKKVVRALNYTFQAGIDSGTLSDDKMREWAKSHTLAEARALSPADGQKLFSL